MTKRDFRWFSVSRLLRSVWRVPLGALLLASATAIAADPPPQPTVLYTSTYTYLPLQGNRDVFPSTPQELYTSVLMTPLIALQAGEARRVIGQLDVQMPGGHDNPEVGNSIRCFNQQGKEVATSGSGSNYTGSGHSFQWNASLLLVAPAAGNYFCQLAPYVSATPGGWHMTAEAPASGQTTYGTWLKYSSGQEVGAQTWSDGIGVCQTSGGAGCAYVGGPARIGNPKEIDVFTDDSFTASTDATTVDGEVTFQITTCTSGTSSCPAQQHGDSGVRDGKGLAWLDLDQLNPDGLVCQHNRVYSEVPGREILLSENYDISDGQHHRPLYFDVSAPVSQLCGGSRRFLLDLHIQWTADNGVKIDGGYANVINSVRVTTTTVPPVIGLSQAQAKSAILAAGLYMPAPNNVTSTLPVGTVIAQNAPSGTVEPAGSPVQVAVSLGQTTVPDVLGDSWAKAKQALANVGLAAVAGTPVIDCANQAKVGTVSSQNPAANAQVSQGTQVSLRMIACNK